MPVAARPAPRRAAQPGRWRAWVYQALLVVVVVAAVAVLAHVTLAHMRERGIRSGFGFLGDPAGFDIGEGWLPYQPSSPYWQAFLAGIVNTLRAAIPAIVACTLIGVALGVGRLAPNAPLRGLCRAWVEVARNVPLLLQLLTWYLLLTEYLPSVDEAWTLGTVARLSKNGLEFGDEFASALSPEYLAVVLGLTVYTSAYVAEVVRAGILAVPEGQVEAAEALGLLPAQKLRLVVLPQALRLIVPPLTNQYLNLTKNSSLAVAVGYPDLVSVANTSLNQSGRAVECIAIIMAVYLVLSLATAWMMGAVNRRAALRER
ncbi:MULTISPECIES: ABC transporter permease subunit [Ramlibacter]|uniref:ABC transporter permease subunit n=1 Tax=Ramlibacter pinisoli TaxID=2682844 RepID=A0A6N8IND5_9BURK|nr:MULTISPECIES: ABC transporter permease subunit [Ramlibacter]MBA2963410.1 ABC transporter permease subunit [Ramlibacter sp. CGMCC 1.13660]MVQ28377.1 ABC transporter permease subunit [Ramlibacter pinisoli]